MEDLELEANIAAMWEAVRQLNENNKILAAAVNKLNSRLRLQECATIAHEAGEVRDTH